MRMFEVSMSEFKRLSKNLNYIKNNPLSNRKADNFTSNIRKSMDPSRVSWNSISKFVDKF